MLSNGESRLVELEALLKRVDQNTHFLAAIARCLAEADPKWEATTYTPYFVPTMVPLFADIRQALGGNDGV